MPEPAASHSSPVTPPRPGASADGAGTTVVEIPITQLAPDPFQPRTAFNERTIADLASSIRQLGILQPLLVRPMQGPDSQGRYWIVAGERRYRAAQSLEMETLPCRIRPYENLAAAVVALAENVHREDLSEIDKAEALLRIKVLTNRTWEEVAGLVKLSRDYVKRLAGLTRLDPSVQELLRAGELPVRTAIALMPLPPRRQVEMAERARREGLTAEQVRQEVRTLRAPRPHAGEAPAASASLPRDGSTRPATRAERLELYTAVLREMEEWLGEGDWAPSRISPGQRVALDRCYETLTRVQQHLMTLRRSLRETEESDADRLRHGELFR